MNIAFVYKKRNSGFYHLITKSSYAYHFIPIKVCSPLKKLLLNDYLHVHTVFVCFLQSASIVCSLGMKVLRFQKFHDVNMMLFCKGGDPFGTKLSDKFVYKTARQICLQNCPTSLFSKPPDKFVLKKSYWHYHLLTVCY